MIHVFGDSYCDPCNGHLPYEKRYFNLLGEQSFVFGLAGSSIEWSLDIFLKGHNFREGKVIFIESIPRRFQYLHDHKKFINYFHQHYKDYHKATKSRSVLKALSDKYEKVIYFATSHNNNRYGAVNIENSDKFIIPKIKLMDISRSEIKDNYDPSFKDIRSNHFTENNHEKLALYIKRLFNNEQVDDIKFDENVI